MWSAHDPPKGICMDCMCLAPQTSYVPASLPPRCWCLEGGLWRGDEQLISGMGPGSWLLIKETRRGPAPSPVSGPSGPYTCVMASSDPPHALHPSLSSADTSTTRKLLPHRSPLIRGVYYGSSEGRSLCTHIRARTSALRGGERTRLCCAKPPSLRACLAAAPGHSLLQTPPWNWVQ